MRAKESYTKDELLDFLHIIPDARRASLALDPGLYPFPVTDVTRILTDIRDGKGSADQLLPLVYEELRRIAALKMSSEAPGHTLQPTALVHEAWLRIVGDQNPVFDGRAHFFTAAAEAMRRILVDAARRRQSLKRGAGARPEDAIAVLGHGTRRESESEKNVYAMAKRVRASGRFAEAGAVFLDQEPGMLDMLEIFRAGTVVVVPLFVADGWHAGQTIPADLSLEGAETRKGGRIVRYTRAVGTHPSLTAVIEQLAGSAAE